MEKDTVILSTEEYNRLRDFMKNIKDGKIMCICTEHHNNNREYTLNTAFYTEKEVIEQVVEENQQLVKDINELTRIKFENQNLKRHLDVANETIKELKSKNLTKPIIEDLKEMGFWKLRKWQKENKKEFVDIVSEEY